MLKGSFDQTLIYHDGHPVAYSAGVDLSELAAIGYESLETNFSAQANPQAKRTAARPVRMLGARDAVAAVYE